jgi:hypothetical protein
MLQTQLHPMPAARPITGRCPGAAPCATQSSRSRPLPAAGLITQAAAIDDAPLSPPCPLPAGRRSSKIVSLMASCFTGNYVRMWAQYLPDTPMQYTPMFDARAVCYPSTATLRDYLSWRQADTHINNQVGDVRQRECVWGVCGVGWGGGGGNWRGVSPWLWGPQAMTSGACHVLGARTAQYPCSMCTAQAGHAQAGSRLRAAAGARCQVPGLQ